VISAIGNVAVDEAKGTCVGGYEKGKTMSESEN